MTSTYGERLYESLISQPFLHAMPETWTTTKEAAIEALDGLAARARDYASKPSRQTMLEQLKLAIPLDAVNWPAGSDIEREYGGWLDDVAWDIATGPEPVAVQNSGLAFPEPPPGLASFHPDALDALKEWAHDEVSDVADGVDAQAVALLARVPQAWMSDSCGTNGASKDFLGAVMRYKTSLLEGDGTLIVATIPEGRLPRRARVVHVPGGVTLEPGDYIELDPGCDDLLSARVVNDDGTLSDGRGSNGRWWFHPSDIEEVPWSVPQVGQWFTVTRDNPYSSGYRLGDVVLVTSPWNVDYGDGVNGGRGEVRVAGGATTRVLHRDAMSFLPVTEPAAEVGRIIDSQTQPLQEQIETLEKRNADLVAELEKARALHREDFAVISRHFWENAHRRGWCSEAEDVIASINEETHESLETDRYVYRPTRSYYFDLEVKFAAEDDHRLTWFLHTDVEEVEVVGVDEEDAKQRISEAAIIERAKRRWPSLPDDLRVSEWDFA